MSIRSLLSRLLSILLPLAIAASLYLYLYPIAHGCAFALPTANSKSSNHRANHLDALLNTLRQHLNPHNAKPTAPIRLLILADPQLEGDSSLPTPEEELLPRLHHHWTEISASTNSTPVHVLGNISTAVSTFTAQDIPRAVHAARKRADLLGNDYYLAHIFRALHWWTKPSHVTVLGDLLGSQWVTDGEFEVRGRRFWKRVFAGTGRVEEGFMRTGEGGYTSEIEVDVDDGEAGWTRRIINVAGNHDIGYAGDVSASRIERFERVFGRANWDVRFRLPDTNASANTGGNQTTPTLHLINLNSLTLDTPAYDQDIQSATYAYLNDLIEYRSRPVEDNSSFTLLLTHLPLHKRDGVCTDGPHFAFFDEEDDEGDDDENVPRWKEGGLREQNHLSEHVSQNGILQGIFGMSGDLNAPAAGAGRNGLILTGHDHTGCDVVHYVDRSVIPSSEEEAEESDSETESEGAAWHWNATRYTSTSHHSQPQPEPSIREVTLRSMMGEFGGNAGLLSLWFDGEWRYEISTCAVGVQHIWWAVHVFDLLVLGMAVAWLGLLGSRDGLPPVRGEKKAEEEKKGKTVPNGLAKTRSKTGKR